MWSVCVVAVCRVILVFISAVYGVLYRSVCVGSGCLRSPGCGRGMCSRGSWWRFKVLGVVFVIKSLRRLWVFSVVVRLHSGNECVVWLKWFRAIYKYVFTYPSFWIGGGLDSRCLGRETGADVPCDLFCQAGGWWVSMTSHWPHSGTLSYKLFLINDWWLYTVQHWTEG